MYQINPTANQLIELKAKRFAELGFKERTQAPTAATSAQLEKLRALKASLLDAAFRGQLPSDQ